MNRVETAFMLSLQGIEIASLHLQWRKRLPAPQEAESDVGAPEGGRKVAAIGAAHFILFVVPASAPVHAAAEDRSFIYRIIA